MSFRLPRAQHLIWLIALAALAATIPLLAADARARLLAANTVWLAGTVATASVALGAPLAFLLGRTDVRGRNLLAILLLTLLFTPLYLQAAAWEAGFGLQGWFTSMVGGPVLLEGWRGAIAVHTFAAIPWVTLIVGVGLRLAEPELEEEALLDGTPGQVFWHVTLRRAASAVAAAFLWVAISTAGEMTVTDLFQIRTYAEEIYTEFALGDSPTSAPWNLVPNLIATVWVIAAGLMLVSWLIPSDRHTTQRKIRPFRLGRWRWPASILAATMVALLVGGPIGGLVAKTGIVVTRGAGGLDRSWSAEQCAAMVLESPQRFAREFFWSSIIGVLAATAAVVIGLGLAWSARRGGRRAVPAWMVIALTLALPGPLIGLGLIAVFSAADWPWLTWLYDRSIAAVTIAQAVRALPLCTLVLWYALRTVPEEHLDSATLEGASALTRFFRIALPQRWPAVAAAWLVGLAIAWGELSASILVVPPGVTTLPIQIFGLIHYGVDDRVAGVSLAVIAIFAALAVLLAALARAADRP